VNRGQAVPEMKETPGDILNVAQKNDYRLPSSDGCTQPTYKTAKTARGRGAPGGNTAKKKGPNIKFFVFFKF